MTPPRGPPKTVGQGGAARPVTPPRGPPPRASELAPKGLAALRHNSAPKSPSNKSSRGETEGEESSPRTSDPTGRSEGPSPSRARSRTPLQRRPHGSKQRKKFERGEFGDKRVRFANPLVAGEKGQGDGPKGKKGKGKKGKGKGRGGKHKGGKQKGKSPGKDRSRSPQQGPGGGGKKN